MDFHKDNELSNHHFALLWINKIQPDLEMITS